MPIRFLVYAGMVYESTNTKCVCFYNGRIKTEEVVILKLSDSFKPDSKPDIEVTVTMININYGRNKT